MGPIGNRAGNPASLHHRTEIVVLKVFTVTKPHMLPNLCSAPRLSAEPEDGSLDLVGHLVGDLVGHRGGAVPPSSSGLFSDRQLLWRDANLHRLPFLIAPVVNGVDDSFLHRRVWEVLRAGGLGLPGTAILARRRVYR